MKYRELAEKSIKNFDLEEFFLRKNDYCDDFGGCLLITSKQRILSLNGSDGRSVHYNEFAILMSEIYNIELENFSPRQLFNCRGYENMIHARLVNDGTLCGMFFSMSDVEKISINEYNSFVEFYNQYNDRIRNLSNTLGKNLVMYRIGEEDGESQDLTPILEILKKLIDENKIDQDENIIEVSNEDNHLVNKEIIVNEYQQLLEKYNEFIKKDFTEDDYSKYKIAIEKIEKEILDKANDEYTLEERKQLIIEMSEILNEMNKGIFISDNIIIVMREYMFLDSKKGMIPEEEYNKKLDVFFARHNLDFIIHACELITKEKNADYFLSYPDMIEFAKKKLAELQNNDVVQLVV